MRRLALVRLPSGTSAEDVESEESCCTDELSLEEVRGIGRVSQYMVFRDPLAVEEDSDSPGQLLLADESTAAAPQPKPEAPVEREWEPGEAEALLRQQLRGLRLTEQEIDAIVVESLGPAAAASASAPQTGWCEELQCFVMDIE